jgi:uncharacterized membrane protein YfcA
MDGLTLLIVACVLLIGGSIAGTFSGFLGIGGAFILIPFQFLILTQMGYPPDIAMKTSIATTLCFTFPTALNSAYNHSKKGTVLWKKSAFIGVNGFIFSFIGAYIATLLSAAVLSVIFGIIVLATSLRISVKKENEDENNISTNAVFYIICGMAMGLACGLVGIGGGLILIPLMVFLLKFPMRNAVGSSSAAIVFTSAGGVCGYLINGIGIENPIPYTIGYINPVFWVLLVIPGILFSRWGVSLSHKTDPKKIRQIFSILAFLIGSFMIINGAALWMA